ncbi:MAG: hypothetical protein FJ290_15025 [Planctomycetes bacterium]|nr:hypothetical protein [Planctomycetota bacterium]
MDARKDPWSLCVLYVGLVALFMTAHCSADEYPIKVYPCPRLEAAPAIDGQLDDPCWAKAPLVSGFTLYNKPKLMDVQTSFREKKTPGVFFASATAVAAICYDAEKDSGSLFLLP